MDKPIKKKHLKNARYGWDGKQFMIIKYAPADLMTGVRFKSYLFLSKQEATVLQKFIIEHTKHKE